MEIRPGRTYPYGATYDGAGTNFAIFSELAEKVELCLFDDHGRETRIELPEVTGHCWHGYLPNIVVGQSYGYRVHGPWNPAEGHLCNPNKLLIDPYARSIQGDIVWNDAIFPHSGPDGGWEMNTKDSASFVPKSVVTNPFFDWTDDVKPRTPWNETVIYEVHAKGFSVINPDIPAEQRGTYSGLSHPAALDYLKKLGVTAVELMPVHHFVHDGHLQEKGLRNYWGYNTIGYFAPHADYAARQFAGSQVAEFKQMVKTLHNAGIEVILDVVYNHTAEGNHLGPMLSLKGIDNTAYYRVTEDAHYYMDYTGTGNSLNMQHPNVLQLIMDSLRYWIQEMHVDGFRFDLASTLARELHDVDRLSAFFDIIQQDPIISRVKLIAEPWDVGDGGYQVGNFPVGWSEWNGKYRDCIRDFWRGTDQKLGEFAYRVTGSSDLYENTGRRPYASINFVTAHDGFTLEDLVSYNEKHNEANGEDNQDGESHNSSWNCGVEGPTADPEVLSLRYRQKRNFLTTLFLSQGVPMLVSGDELGRTQGGNNNGYCQDNETSWVNWEDIDQELLEFTRGLIEFRRKHPVFRRRHWFQGRAVYGKGLDDLNWFTPDGLEMEDHYWNEGFSKSVGIFLNGKAIISPDERGLRITDDSFYLIINAHYEDLSFALPDKVWGRRWKEILSTEYGFCEDRKVYAAGDELLVTSRSIKVLKRTE
ncbi:MAG: glycogen debranching enzyme GlgX [Spirochaetaceae bacterium]|nr:MAG: glycogen debranching enzyme GlgX [Spirochaetaceae bacterium]